MTISFFTAFLIMLALHIIGTLYALRLRKELKNKYPERLRQIGLCGIKFAKSICENWPEVTDPEILKLKNKVKNYQSTAIIFLLSYCLLMFIILTIFAVRKNP